jgi:hypothetical protein
MRPATGGIIRTIHLYLFTIMDFTPRRKKSDKAKEKAGMPSSKHVRQHEALMEKKATTVPVKKK